MAARFGLEPDSFSKAFAKVLQLLINAGLYIQAFCDIEPIYTYEGTYEVRKFSVLMRKPLLSCRACSKYARSLTEAMRACR